MRTEKEAAVLKSQNKFNLMEWAGAFGDLGTLIPFIVAYISILKLEPTGILLVFGLALISSGLYYKTPIPIQPMKAIGAVTVTKAGITAGMVWGAGIFTGIFWLLMGLTNVIKYVSKVAKKPIVTGVIIGLGLSFMKEAIKLMISNPILAVSGVALTFLLLQKPKVPAIFILLCLGVTYTFMKNPTLINELSQIKFAFKLPQLTITKINFTELVKGIMLLALPQIPLTVGNGILSITTENNRLFPQRTVNDRKITISTGLMNIVAATFGGVPICHGAGGMAGHVRFGAKTGGSIVILGVILTILATFFSSSVLIIFHLIPNVVLGVILFFAGYELLQVIKTIDKQNTKEIIIISLTAIISIYNVGVGFLLGLILFYIFYAKKYNQK